MRLLRDVINAWQEREIAERTGTGRRIGREVFLSEKTVRMGMTNPEQEGEELVN